MRSSRFRMLAGLAAVLLMGAAAGCAAQPRAQAYNDLKLAENAPYRFHDQDFTRQDQPELADGATLDDYLVYAALNNPGLEAAFDRWRAALNKVPQATALPDPQLTYGYYLQRDEANPVTDRLGLWQMFPWFGKLDAAGRMALAEAEAERQRLEAQRLKLFRDVRKNYYEYYYLAREVDVVRENVKQVTDLENLARASFEAGKVPYSDVLKAQVELGELQNRLVSAQDVLGPTIAKLNASMNRPAEAPLPAPVKIAEGNATLSEERLKAMLRENSPELKAVDAMASRETAAVRLARKSFYPDVSIGGDYMRQSDPGMPNPFAAMVMLNLPIWRGKYKAGVNEATLNYHAALRERHDLENNLIADLQMSLYSFRDAERKMRLYQGTLVPKARQAVKVSEQALQAGNADFLDVIDAQRTLLEFELAGERALADRAQALAEIEMLVGEAIPREKPTESIEIQDKSTTDNPVREPSMSTVAPVEKGTDK